MIVDWPHWPDASRMSPGNQWVWGMRLLRAVLDQGFLPSLRRWDECR